MEIRNGVRVELPDRPLHAKTRGQQEAFCGVRMRVALNSGLSQEEAIEKTTCRKCKEILKRRLGKKRR